METADLKIIYEDEDLLVLDKPAGIAVFPEKETAEKHLVDLIIEVRPEMEKTMEPPRYGIIHRLDKNTSGVLLSAKTPAGLIFFQKQFKNGSIEKKYLALAIGRFSEDKGTIETLIGRSPKNYLKQKVFLEGEPGWQNKRKAKTEYQVIEQFEKYALLEVSPKNGRKHQIRCHLAHINHPIAGDDLYGFKNQACPKDLTRQFLHAKSVKIKMVNGEEKEFVSELPEDLKKIIKNLN